MILLDLLKVVSSDQITEESISKFIPRIASQLDEIRGDVLTIINEVKNNGDEAILKFTKKFDGVELSQSEIKVDEKEIENAYNKIDKNLLDALRYAKKNLIKFHKAQKRSNWTINIEKGVKAGQIYRPLDVVGVYVPGGRAIYPSTLLMAATPAYVANVKNLIVCSPPQKNKEIAPEILVAACEYNIKNIFKVGGVQAIAAMAYGTKMIPKVQKVVGPGNKWVNAAKQLLINTIAIDNPAGPSEILIIADDTANINYLAVDFISQIEHDPDNIGILISNSDEIIKKFSARLENLLENLERKQIVKTALNNSLIVKAKDIDDCVRVSNIIAPEHLEILTKNPKLIVPKITNAGAIFLGPNSPVPLGDYSAGTNHILPTGGNAKRYSGLNLYDFLKVIETLDCNEKGLKLLSKSAMKIAEFEGLFSHKKSIEERLKNKK